MTVKNLSAVRGKDNWQYASSNCKLVTENGNWPENKRLAYEGMISIVQLSLQLAELPICLRNI